MANFTTRVELLGSPPESEYEKLHKEMAKRGFRRTITINGETFELPHAEYNSSSDSETAEQMKDKAVAAAQTVQKEFRVLVTETQVARKRHNLEKAK